MAKSNRVSLHFECLVGGLFEHDYVPGDAPVPCTACQAILNRARDLGMRLIDREESR